MITVTVIESKPNVRVDMTWDEAVKLRVAISWAREQLDREYKTDYFVLLHGLERQLHEALNIE